MFPAFPAHLRRRPVSRGNSRHSVGGGVTCRNTPISRPTLEKNPMPGHLFEGNPVDEGTTEGLLKLPCIVHWHKASSQRGSLLSASAPTHSCMKVLHQPIISRHLLKDCFFSTRDFFSGGKEGRSWG